MKKQDDKGKTRTAAQETTARRVAESKKEFLEALAAAGGIVSSACKAADISRVTFYKWLHDDADFAEKVTDIKELQKDFCEALILKQMKAGNTKMIIFYATTQMKDRGYSVRSEVVDKTPYRPKELTIEELAAFRNDLEKKY